MQILRELQTDVNIINPFTILINMSENHQKKNTKSSTRFFKSNTDYFQKSLVIPWLHHSPCQLYNTRHWQLILRLFTSFQNTKASMLEPEILTWMIKSEIHYLQVLRCLGAFYRKATEIATFLEAQFYTANCSPRLWSRSQLNFFYIGLSETGGRFPSLNIFFSFLKPRIFA